MQPRPDQGRGDLVEARRRSIRSRCKVDTLRDGHLHKLHPISLCHATWPGRYDDHARVARVARVFVQGTASMFPTWYAYALLLTKHRVRSSSGGGCHLCHTRS